MLGDLGELAPASSPGRWISLTARTWPQTEPRLVRASLRPRASSRDSPASGQCVGSTLA